MKKVLLLCLLIAEVSYGQIFTQSGTEGAILITPKGLRGKSNSSADTFNLALGASALRNNITGSANTAIGIGALLSNTTGYSNTANGTYSLRDNTIGFYNSATGAYALINNTTGNTILLMEFGRYPLTQKGMKTRPMDLRRFAITQQAMKIQLQDIKHYAHLKQVSVTLRMEWKRFIIIL